MSRFLPENPSLDHTKNKAKSILKAIKKQDPGVCSILRNLKDLRKSNDVEIFDSKITLQQVQHALAIDYGFVS